MARLLVSINGRIILHFAQPLIRRVPQLSIIGPSSIFDLGNKLRSDEYQISLPSGIDADLPMISLSISYPLGLPAPSTPLPIFF